MQKSAYKVPEFGKLTQLCDDLYWARFALPFRLNHINLYIIDTASGWVIIDSGIHSPDTMAQWQALLEGPLSHQPVSQIIVTHHHVDHIGYAGPLQALTKAPVKMTKAEFDKAQWLFCYDDDGFADLIGDLYQSYGLDEAQCALARSDKGRFGRHVAPLPEVSFLAQGDIIESRHGQWQCRVDMGHSDAHIGLMDKTRGLYIATDFLLPRISPNISVDIRDIGKDMLGDYLTYLAEMTSLDEGWQIFPGHDWPFTQGGHRARALIDHHQQRLSALLEAAATAPLSTADAMSVLFGRDFEAHELYFASGEARAHINHLVHLGKMKPCAKQTPNDIDYFALSHP